MSDAGALRPTYTVVGLTQFKDLIGFSSRLKVRSKPFFARFLLTIRHDENLSDLIRIDKNLSMLFCKTLNWTETCQELEICQVSK